ncbi:MAG: substrate-binding domain-containing protein, partial [Termitinemataceae bacterium]
GALRALSEAGIRVPEEVSVTGFDDTEESRFCIPSLTTVHQDAVELGKQAILVLASQLGIFPKNELYNKEAGLKFIIRESCGCLPTYSLVSPLECSSLSKSQDSDELLALYAKEINTALSKGKNPASLSSIAIPADLRDKAALILSEGIARYQASLRRAVERRAAVLREIEASLVASFALTDILSEVAKGTKLLGISGCWLVLFESMGTTPEWSRLLLASQYEKVRILAPYGFRFHTFELLPGGLPPGKVYVIEPLRFGEERLGYLVCTADSEDRQVFEALRDQVSGAIKGALLMAAERDRERRLEQDVRLRTIELSSANDRLREEINRRTALERELLDISNDIMARIGRDIHDDLCQNIAGLGLMAAILEGNLRRIDCPSAQKLADSAASISIGASKTAAQAKGIARGLYPAELEAKGLVAAVEDLIDAVRERSTADIRLKVSKTFTIKNSDKALQLYRIIQEALNNAVNHARASSILVSLSMDRETVTVEVADDGIGIQLPSSGSHGMGLRIMKYRASVIGAELRIKNLTPGSSVCCRVAR